MVTGSSKKVMVCRDIQQDRKMCGLVVDDDPVIRRVHGTLLNRHGLETETVKNGKEAVDLFISGKTYDLVVMDREMPVMDGIQATEKLRAMGVNSMIIGVTACTQGEDKEAFLKAGLDDCWDKPLNAHLLNVALINLTKKLQI